MRTAFEPGQHALTIAVGGYTREYLLHVPPQSAALITGSAKTRKPCRPQVGRPSRSSAAAELVTGALPLVIMLHGGGGNAKLAALTTRWSEKADEIGFFVAYPEALRPARERPPTFLRNPQFWNVGSGLGYAEKHGVDDVAFIRALIDELCERLPVDRQRVYATGFSNGAALTFCLGMRLSDRLAAIAPVSGYPWRQQPRPEHPVSLIYISGTADPMNPIDGSAIESPWGRLPQRPPVEAFIRQWAEWVGCSSKRYVLEDKDGVRRMRSGPNEKGVDVEYITISGAGHAWPGGPALLAERIAGKPTDKLNATDVIWDFVRRHPKA